MTLQLLREGRKVQQVVYGREYMLRYVQRSTCSGVFMEEYMLTAQVCSWISTFLVMFMEEYMLRYVHGGVHA